VSAPLARARLRDRIVGLAIFLPSAALLGIARWLTPDPSGVGTHEQLGLAGCMVLSRLGVPCPMCGMTTTFSHMAHLQVGEAFLNQPFGVLLFLVTVVVAVLGGLDILAPRQRCRRAARWLAQRDVTLAVVILATLVGGWIYKVALMQKMFPWSP